MNSESSTNVLTRQWRIAEIAKQHPERSLNCIHHHLDLDWLRVAYGRLKKDKAPGYDAQTVWEYGNDLDRRLTDLLTRVKGGNYCAPPVKRVRIPKGEGNETRPIGIPTTEKAQMTWARYISMLNGNFNLPPARIVHSDRVAKPQIRGTGCPKGARPDLWGRP